MLGKTAPPSATVRSIASQQGPLMICFPQAKNNPGKLTFATVIVPPRTLFFSIKIVLAPVLAAEIAAKLGAENIILMTDIRGLLRDKNDESTLIPVVNVSEVPYLIRQGIISGGMIPKIECCVEAVRRGVNRAFIIDGRIDHSILIEMLSDEGIGTMFL